MTVGAVSEGEWTGDDVILGDDRICTSQCTAFEGLLRRFRLRFKDVCVVRYY